MEKRKPEEDTPLRVMSSNVLFDKTGADRAPLLYRLYEYRSPDLLGLQEVNGVFHEKLTAPMLASGGYSRARAWPDPDNMKDFERVSLSKRYPPVNFFPILYKTVRFTEEESGFYMYRSTFTYTKGVTWVVLRERNTGRLLAHINTHAAVMLATYEIENKTPEMSENWRLDNCSQILGTAAEIRSRHGDIPIFITGDFNAGENSPSYKRYLEGGFLNSKYTASREASRNTGSFHPVGAPPPSGEGADKTPIDHIFVSAANISVIAHRIDTSAEALVASDHCPIYIDATI